MPKVGLSKSVKVWYGGSFLHREQSRTARVNKTEKEKVRKLQSQREYVSGAYQYSYVALRSKNLPPLALSFEQRHYLAAQSGGPSTLDMPPENDDWEDIDMALPPP